MKIRLKKNYPSETWFAWYPVEIEGNDFDTYVWLEPVERIWRESAAWGFWEYKLPESLKDS